MKTWLEYINEEAGKLGFDVARLVDSVGQFWGYRIFQIGEPLGGSEDPQDFKTRETVEAFLLGVTFGRTGAL